MIFKAVRGLLPIKDTQGSISLARIIGLRQENGIEGLGMFGAYATLMANEFNDCPG